MRQQLGPECFSRPYDSFTGYLGELYGISLATKMFQVVIICVDSQAAIRAVGLPKKKKVGGNILCNALYKLSNA